MTAGTITMRLPSIPALVYEVLWDRLDLGAMPFPVAVLQHGRDRPERAGYRAQADEWLSFNGLGSTNQVDGALSQALCSTATADVVLSLLYSDIGGHTRVGCFPTPGGRALRVILRDDTVEMGWMNARRLADGALETVPRLDPGTGRPLWIPEPALSQAGRIWRTTGKLSHAVRHLARRGTDRASAERFLTLYSTAHAIGQACALRHAHSALPTLTSTEQTTFLDTREGRYLISHTAGCLTLVPADHRMMTARMTQLLMGDFRPRRRAAGPAQRDGSRRELAR